MPEPTATNPQTGEKVVFRGGQWVPMTGEPPQTPAAPQQAAPGPPAFIPGTPRPAPPPPPPPNPYTQGQDDFANVLKLRDDYNADPTVKSYRTAIQQLGQALQTGEGAQADLALTYAFSKAMDPDSVVRDSEQQMVIESQPWFQSSVEAAKKQFGMDEAGTYTPEARQELRRQIASAVAQRNRAYIARREYFREFSDKYGFDPRDVIGEHDGAPFLPMLEQFQQGGEQPASAVPNARQSNAIPGIREPSREQVFSGGVQWDIDQPDMAASRAEVLSRQYGVDPGEEAEINAFWNANRGNPDLTVDNVRQWYQQRGIRVNDADIATAIEQARKPGVTFEGSGAEDAEAQYNEQLDQALQTRGAEPESLSGAVGVNAAQGFTLGAMDEIAGLGGLGRELVTGGNPVAGYQTERDLIRREQERAQEARPITSAASEIIPTIATGGVGFARSARAGGLARQAYRMGNTARGNALAGTAVRSSVVPGAATGAAYGFNTGEGPVGSPVNAMLGAGTGAALAPLATAGGIAAGRGINVLRGPAQRPAAAQSIDPYEVQQMQAQTGIPIMTSDVRPPSTFMGKAGQALGERIPIAGTGGVRAAQQESRREAAETLLRDYGGMNDTSAIGDVAQDLTEQRGRELTRWTGLRDGIKAKLTGQTIPTTNLTQAIDQQIAALKSANNENLNPLIDKLVKWRKAAQGQGIDNLEELRREIGDALGDPTLASIKGRAQKVADALYSPLRTDIGDFIGQTLGNREKGQWLLANRNLSEMAGELKSTRLRNVLQTGDITPENVGNLLFSAKPSEIRMLYNGLSDTGKANARAAIMQHVYGKLNELAGLGGDPQAITPERFLQVLKTVGKPIGVFFEGADEARVHGLVRALQLTQRAGQANVSTPTGQQVVPWVMGGASMGTPLAMGASAPTAVGISVFLGGTIGAAARIYESAPVRNLLLKLSRSKPGSPQEATTFQQLQGAIARLPAANDNAAAISASPQRAAAQDEND